MQVCDVARILVDWRGTFVCSTEYLAAIRFKWSKVGFVPRCVISDKPQRTARIPKPVVGAERG
ncbi:MAG: hypothetical protein P8Q93_01090 [Ascidiaceihabitans sp.]|nr:hypothetical protein [Ascidiaceihabitans sp.]